MLPCFSDRASAGKSLAHQLLAYKDRPDVLVLALPRGGVPVAFEIAKALHAPLDLMLVRKLGVPGQEELAMGAIAVGDVLSLNDDVVHVLGITRDTLERVIRKETEELLRRNNVYRAGREAPDLRDKLVILVDDGCATGANMRAAVMAARKLHPKKIIVAIPIASDSACDALSDVADGVVYGFVPPRFTSLGEGYDDFRQVEDDEVVQLLRYARQNSSRDHEHAGT